MSISATVCSALGYPLLTNKQSLLKTEVNQIMCEAHFTNYVYSPGFNRLIIFYDLKTTYKYSLLRII